MIKRSLKQFFLQIKFIKNHNPPIFMNYFNKKLFIENLSNIILNFIYFSKNNTIYYNKIHFYNLIEYEQKRY